MPVIIDRSGATGPAVQNLANEAARFPPASRRRMMELVTLPFPDRDETRAIRQGGTHGSPYAGLDSRIASQPGAGDGCAKLFVHAAPLLYHPVTETSETNATRNVHGYDGAAVSGTSSKNFPAAGSARLVKVRLCRIGGVLAAMQLDMTTPHHLRSIRSGNHGLPPKWADRTAFSARPCPPHDRAETILILFQDFAAGGTEHIMVRLANIWARERRVIIVCGSREGPALAALSDRVELREATPPIPRSLVSRWRLGRRLKSIIAEYEPDVIVGPGNHVLMALAALGPGRVPVVCKLSNPLSLGAAIPRLIQRGIHAAIFRSVVRVVAMSPALEAEAAHLLPHKKVTVIAEPILPPGRDVSIRLAPKGGLNLLFAGRLVAQKNPALAIHTLARLPESARLTIVGSGPQRRQLQDLALSLGIGDRVVFTGQVPSIDPYLAKADMLILPSRYEGYPAVLIEALSFGVPVITTPCSPSLDEILLDPSFGRIVKADADALANAVIGLRSSDAPERRPLGKLIERHSADISARHWLDCLDETVRSAWCSVSPPIDQPDLSSGPE